MSQRLRTIPVGYKSIKGKLDLINALTFWKNLKIKRLTDRVKQLDHYLQADNGTKVNLLQDEREKVNLKVIISKLDKYNFS